MAYVPLASIGITVKVGQHVIAGATDIGDIGGQANTLDVTTLTDTVRKNIAGVQDQGSFDITYNYNNAAASDDFRVLQAFSDATPKVSQDVEVTFPDGTKFANTGQVTNRVSGVGVDAVIKAVCSIALDGTWTVTNPV